MNTLKHRHMVALAVLFPLLWCGGGLVPAHAATGTARLVWYTSPVDGSQQAYGIYVPGVRAAGGGYPAVFHTHGYGWGVSSRFSEWQQRWSDTHAWALINLNARGPQFYEGIGEIATMEVVRDATARFGLDPGRLYMTGSSMGGTGAFRHGVRHPDTFAAAVGVDGWTDFRLWHHHWYARGDYRDAIEEFRRPLLMAASPLYWARRAKWGSVKAIVDGRDTTVWPDNGLQLHSALWELALQGGGYDSDLRLNYNKGHGGGYSLSTIYDFFLGRERVAEPHSFHCATYLLKHGRMYWGAVDAFHTFGLPAVLGSGIAGDTVSVATDNVDGFTLYLEASPVARAASVSIYADGLLCYTGSPGTLSFEALRGSDGHVAAWLPVPAPAPLLPHKTAELAGPIGDVFTRPFVVAYGTIGPPPLVAQHRREAEAFASAWRAFMIRRGAAPDAIGPFPEDEISPQLMRDRGLLIFGTRESSRLLQAAYAAADIPVIVGDSYVTVAGDGGDDRTWHGDNFGAFVCYPNPLCDGRQYLLIARGQWFTKPDRTIPAGLEYDMEKLPWGYPDYVVFNTDQSQLPHVLNVNNKPPVTCYQAAYFVEAGFFDSRWQPDRALTLDRARIVKPPGVSFIHVDQVKPSADGLDVVVLSDTGAPFADARVTMDWPAAPLSVSALTDEQGRAHFTRPDGLALGSPARVLSVMGTGAVYDFAADMAHSSADGPLRLVLSRPTQSASLQGDCSYLATATLANRGDRLVTGTLRPTAAAGAWSPASAPFTLQPNGTLTTAFHWHPAGTDGHGQAPPGDYRLSVTARPKHPHNGRSAIPAVTAATRLRLGLLNASPLALDELIAADIAEGGPFDVSCDVLNTAPDDATVELACSIIPADTDLGDARRHCYLPPQPVAIPGLDKAAAIFKRSADFSPLPVGMYRAVIYSPGHPELTARADFTVTAGP